MESQNFAPQRHQITANSPIQTALEAVLVRARPGEQDSAKDFDKMGGLGSGRQKDRGRKTVESYRTLDVNQLAKNGCLQPGCFSTCQWRHDQRLAQRGCFN
jgi:hypothetical protein